MGNYTSALIKNQGSVVLHEHLQGLLVLTVVLENNPGKNYNTQIHRVKEKCK